MRCWTLNVLFNTEYLIAKSKQRMIKLLLVQQEFSQA
jgi:hypothetical protein